MSTKQIVYDCLPVKVTDIRKPCLAAVDRGTCATSEGFRHEGASKHYLTTAIMYTNGWPHVGHAYEVILADIASRAARLLGHETYFLTGTDEHGLKIAQAAEAEGVPPKAVCDKYMNGFVALNQRLRISNDGYIRTTDEKHKEGSKLLWKMCEKDIFLGKYEGYYLVREERYATDREALEWNYKDPVSGIAMPKLTEACYFFKMSTYQERLKAHIEANPQFVLPVQYRSEILSRLESEPLQDLCVSRTKFSWGIPVPDAPEHVMYVWFDALSNYLTAVGWPKTGTVDELRKFWPADVHLIGKDILWFHAVIWPCMLMSAGLELPKKICVHGFILDADGRKMSKSLGNVIDPHTLLDSYSADSVRWFMASSQFGADVKLALTKLEDDHRADLCDTLGNLVSRSVALAAGRVPPHSDSVDIGASPIDVAASVEEFKAAFDGFQIDAMAKIAREKTIGINKWMTELEPWKIKGEDQVSVDRRNHIVRKLLEHIYVVAHFWIPFLPCASEVIFRKLGAKPMNLIRLRSAEYHLSTGADVPSAKSVLYDPIRKPAGAGTGSSAAPAAAPAAAAASSAPKAPKVSSAEAKQSK